MHNEEITEQRNALCSIVSIENARGYKRAQIEKWSESKLIEKYGDKKSVIDNQPLRIVNKLGELSHSAQLELLEYAKGISGRKEKDLSGQMWEIMRNCSNEDDWESIEEFSNILLMKEHRQMKGMEA